MTTRPRVAVYPGSFDPVTNGHVDIIERGTQLFDQLIVAVLVNDAKTPLFSTAERVQMLRDAFGHRPEVVIDTFDGGLLVDYAERMHAAAIVRGLRAVADFEYEFQMALMNRRLAPSIETVFLMPSEEYTYTSSKLIKEVAKLGGDVRGLVPPAVVDRLRRRLHPADPLTAPRPV